MRLLLTAAILACLAGCAAPKLCGARQPVASVPLAGPPNRPVVDAEIAGHAVRLLLDTGSPVTMLTEDAARRLDLPHESHMFAEITGMGGQAVVGTTNGERLSFAGAPAPAEHIVLLASAGLGPGVDGLVGLDVLSRYAIDLDSRHRALRLYADDGCSNLPADWPASARPVNAPMTLDGRMLLPLRLGAADGSALLDTGAAGSVIKRGAADALGARPIAGVPLVHVVGLDGAASPYELRRLTDVTIAGQRLPGLIVAAGSFPLPGDLVIGMDVLSHFRVWLDFPRRLVAIAPAA